MNSAQHCFVSWLCDKFATLEIPMNEDIAQYLLNIDNESDLTEYIVDVLDGKETDDSFVDELIRSWRIIRKKTLPSSEKQEMKSAPSAHKKKTKFVSLYSQEALAKDVVILSGRHRCDCQATKHKLICNCVRCGRIVCEQEGSGPCLFCGSLVCTKDEQEKINSGTKKGEKLRQKLLQVGVAEKNWQKNNDNDDDEFFQSAMQRKNKLLEYDRTSAQRTKVIDDQADYFATDSNRWLTKRERELLTKKAKELHEEKCKSRRDRKVTLDIAGRRVIDEDEYSSAAQKSMADTMLQNLNSHSQQMSTRSYAPGELNRDLVNPALENQAIFMISVSTNSNAKPASQEESNPMTRRTLYRIQDKELQEMGDEGYCMSLHQPLASLLIKGIKKHEGRSWYSAHRGRLWIAATAKPVSLEEIKETESLYRDIPKLTFPEHYPVGCLLGCVNVEDVLPQEQYRIQFPYGESNSPYVFICEAPQELSIKFPIKGQHKIYKLEPQVHSAAKKSLKVVNVNS